MSSLEEHDADQRAMSGEPSNNDRASWANTAVQAHGLETMDSPEDEDISTLIGDLLCNLRHLCDAEGLDFGAVDKGSHRCYMEEIGEQPVANANYAGGDQVNDREEV